jgi:hypothetical protein
MNERNPKGLIGYKSPGRRALADPMLKANFPQECKNDPMFRRLFGAVGRAMSKMLRLPPQTSRLLKQQASVKAQELNERLQQRLHELREDAARRARHPAFEGDES